MKTPCGVVERDGRYYMQADGREYLWDGEGVPTVQDWERRATATVEPEFSTCSQCRAMVQAGETCPGCGSDSQAAPSQPIPKPTEE